MVSVNFNYRCCSSSEKGMRRVMEDFMEIQVERVPEQVGFFAIFDGHGGKEAACYAKKNLWENIKKTEGFHSKDPDDVKIAIKKAFIKTHLDMEQEIEHWPRSKKGNQSTSGTTVTCMVIRGNGLYVAQLGDSGAVLAKRNIESNHLKGILITPEHKPNLASERERIESLGGSVAVSNGTYRVVWKRPISTDNQIEFERIPFLAVSRSLGDLWSHINGNYVVSPEPDVNHFDVNVDEDAFIILASDGLWGVLSPQQAVDAVSSYEEKSPDSESSSYHNSSSSMLVKQAFDKYKKKKLRADNISTIIVFFDDMEQNNDNESTADTVELVLSDSDEDTPPVELPLLTRGYARKFKDFCQLTGQLKSVCVWPEVPDANATRCSGSNTSKRKSMEVSQCSSVSKASKMTRSVTPPLDQYELGSAGKKCKLN